MSGGGGGSSKTVVSSSIPPEFEGIFGDFQSQARRASRDLRRLGPFGGEFIADPNELQAESLRALEDLARNRPDLGTPAVQNALATIRGDFLLPESNPFLQATIDAATRPVLENFQESLLPRIRSNAIAVGAEGGTRNALVEAQATRDTERVIGDIAAQIAFSNFVRERQNQLQGPALGTAAFGLQEATPRLLGEVGDIERGFEQEDLNNAILKFNERIAAIQRPLEPLSQFFSSTGLPLNTVSKTRGGGSSGGGTVGAAQGLVGGAAAGSAFGPVGAVVGGVIGGVAGYF